MMPRRSPRIARERLGSEGDAEYVPQAETTRIHTKRGRPATNSTPNKRTTIKILKGNKSSTIRENNLEEENASLGEKKIRTTPEMAEKRSLQVSNSTDPAPKRLKYDDAFQHSVKALQDSYYQVKQQLQYANEKTIALEISAKYQDIEVETLKAKNSELSMLVDSLQIEAACLKESNKLIQRKYRQLENDKDEIKQNAIQALEHARIHHADELPTISLDTIDKEWRRLVYCIHDLVVQNLTVTPTGDNNTQFSPEIDSMIRKVKKNPELKVPRLERYIWTYLLKAVFKQSSQLWDGDMEIDFVKNVRDLRVEQGLSRMEVMQSRAAEIIIFNLGASEPAKVQYLRDLGKFLEPFTESLTSTKLHEELLLVFDTAISIMEMFIDSRDIYEFGSCFRQPKKIIYDEKIMEISSCLKVPKGRNANQAGRFAVELMHTPPLFIISTTEGEYFGRKELVCPAHVTVSVEEVAEDDMEKGSDRLKEVSHDDAEKGSGGLEDKISDEVSIIVI